MWSRASHTIRRIKQSWAEMDYAQRRLVRGQDGHPGDSGSDPRAGPGGKP